MLTCHEQTRANAGLSAAQHCKSIVLGVHICPYILAWQRFQIGILEIGNSQFGQARGFSGERWLIVIRHTLLPTWIGLQNVKRNTQFLRINLVMCRVLLIPQRTVAHRCSRSAYNR